MEKRFYETHPIFNRERICFINDAFRIHSMQEEFGRVDFLDGSFLDYIEASALVELKRGSRQNYTLKVRKDQFEARHLYNFFFSDGRSQTVWYYDENSYGWHTNPYFQMVVESEYDTFGVPDMYRDALVRSAAFSAHTVSLYTTDVSVGNGQIQCTGTGSMPEWALLQALMKAALVVETKLEVVTFRDDAGSIDFVAEYISLEDLEQMSGNITSQEVQATEDKYILTIKVDVSAIYMCLIGRIQNRRNRVSGRKWANWEKTDEKKFVNHCFRHAWLAGGLPLLAPASLGFHRNTKFFTRPCSYGLKRYPAPVR